MVMLVAITAFVLLCGIAYRYLKNRMKYFERLNSPGPPPGSLLMGNMLEMRGRIMHEVFQEWSRRYGKVFGYYEGGMPILMTTDLDILQDIFVKQFSSFYFSYYEGGMPILMTTDLDILQDIFVKQFSSFYFSYYEGGMPILMTTDLDILQDIFVKQFSSFYFSYYEGDMPILMTTDLDILQDIFVKQFSSFYFSYYEGGMPILMTTDLDILQDIFVKQFSSFYSRKYFAIQEDPDSGKYVSMFIARGARWKRLRTIVNPTFSSVKMRQMTPIMQDSISVFMEILEEKCANDESFDIYGLFQGLTMDAIGRTAFGYAGESQRDPNDNFLRLCKAVMTETTRIPWFAYLSLMFPELRMIWSKIIIASRHLRKGSYDELNNLVIQAVKVWKEQSSRVSGPKNLLQLMLNAELSTEEATSTQFLGDQSTPIKNVERKLMEPEIVSQSVLFLIAGYETTSTALAYAAHLIATHPRVQEKLQAEIDASLKDGSELSKADVDQLPYLEMVVKEVLRMYPVASLVEARTCMQDCHVGSSGLLVPEGLTVSADVWSIHYDPDTYEDPEYFKPERFAPEHVYHPMAWIPFGAGPRICIGMRFALLEIKLAVVTMLLKYSLQVTPETQVPLKLKEGVSTTPESEVILKLKRRFLP